jgi:hypothetical protein
MPICLGEGGGSEGLGERWARSGGQKLNLAGGTKRNRPGKLVALSQVKIWEGLTHELCLVLRVRCPSASLCLHEVPVAEENVVVFEVPGGVRLGLEVANERDRSAKHKRQRTRRSKITYERRFDWRDRREGDLPVESKVGPIICGGDEEKDTGKELCKPTQTS